MNIYNQYILLGEYELEDPDNVIIFANDLVKNLILFFDEKKFNNFLKIYKDEIQYMTSFYFDKLYKYLKSDINNLNHLLEIYIKPRDSNSINIFFNILNDQVDNIKTLNFIDDKKKFYNHFEIIQRCLESIKWFVDKTDIDITEKVYNFINLLMRDNINYYTSRKEFLDVFYAFLYSIKFNDEYDLIIDNYTINYIRDDIESYNEEYYNIYYKILKHEIHKTIKF